jgi:thiosulfate/3-mercaptopyruvate sulfurtransferase
MSNSPYPLIMEVSDLSNIIHNENVLIIDQSPLENFIQGHIPSSVHLSFSDLQASPLPGMLPSIDQLNRIFSKLGLTPEHHVCVCDNEGGGWAGRLIWVLDSIGHTRYSYINGGVSAWASEGHTIESGITSPVPSHYTVKEIHSQFSMTREEIINNLDKENFTILDARSEQEHTGERNFSKFGGHIPGAINFEWTRAMQPQNHLRMKSLSELNTTFNTLGFTQDKEIVTHCQSHHRSGYTYLVGKALNRNMKAYPGSWGEWGQYSSPIEV